MGESWRRRVEGQGETRRRTGRLSGGRWLVLVAAAVLAVAVLPARSARSFERYTGSGSTAGCAMCHGGFTVNPYRSPTGEVWPTTAMNVHRNGSPYMDTACDVCHRSDDARNPFIARSAEDAWGAVPGPGCPGCHGAQYAGASKGYGLRLHHSGRGVVVCATCHTTDLAPAGESTGPHNYGGTETRAHDPCNAPPGYGEDFSGNLRGLDNDGDTLYDAGDADCGGCVDADRDGFSPAGGACGPVDCNDTAAAVNPGAAEICDGVDNDCDAATDEGLFRSCTSICGTGTESCSAGAWVGCTAPLPTVETCNARDDDCDGLTDESLSRTCTTACGTGTESCSAGAWVGCTAPLPAPEACDNRDNDCDGTTDESLSRSCTSACGTGIETCSAGAWVGCTAPLPAPEICDGMDNDCDGATDEGCTCVPGTTRVCGTDLGECTAGTQTCRPSGSWDTCTGGVGPTGESCDNLDNDCDGTTDEGLSRSCSTACGPGTESCSAGAWVGCTAPAPAAETCDGADNDCDGTTDGLTRACSTACGSGIEACVAGSWGVCTAPAPAAESCDGRDNDCDGTTDGLTRECSSSCGTGTELCTAGLWGACSAPEPTAETCNGVDDDCDGATDEGLSRDCSTDCGPGTETCAAGAWVGCTAPVVHEEDCDGTDDDCDGATDEGCACPPGTVQACGSEVGSCVAGSQTCGADGAWGECTGAVGPSVEACNGADDDCDGNLPAAELDGDGDGAAECAGDCDDHDALAGPGRTEGPAGDPSCADGRDNDCDGATDAADDGCGEVCTDGDGDGWSVEGGACGAVDCDDDDRDVHPGATERCNDVDDDCDGTTDEGCGGDAGVDDGGAEDEGADGEATGDDGTDGGVVPVGSGGCACAVAPPRGAHAALLAALLGLVAWSRRRR